MEFSECRKCLLRAELRGTEDKGPDKSTLHMPRTIHRSG